MPHADLIIAVSGSSSAQPARQSGFFCCLLFGVLLSESLRPNTVRGRVANAAHSAIIGRTSRSSS